MRNLISRCGYTFGRGIKLAGLIAALSFCLVVVPRSGGSTPDGPRYPSATGSRAIPNLAIDPYRAPGDREVHPPAPFLSALSEASSSYEIQPLNYLFDVSVEAGQDSIGGRPSIAFDGTNFFTVWKDPRNSNTSSTDVYGTFIARDGTVLNPGGIAIGTAADTDYVPSVIFDGTNYVVTWVSGGGVTDIYAARVAPNGTVLDTPAARITDGADPKFRPISLAFDGTNYLIVWRSSSDEIRGTRVSTSLVNLDGPAGFGIGGGFYPWVAFNGTDYLVVWHGHGANGLDIFGALVGKNGAVLPPGVVTISSDLNDQDHASVASDGTGFLVAWHDWSGADDFQNGRAHAARVTGAGVVLDNPTIKVSDHTLWQVPVQTVYDGGNYFVAWHVAGEANYRLADVVGRRVSSAGAVLDQQTIPLAVSYGHQWGPVMGYGDGRYLVAWNATGGCGNGSSCIRGQMLQKVNTQSATNRANLTSRQLPTSNRNFSSASANPWIAEQSNTGTWLHNIWAFDESHVDVATEADDGTLLGYDGNAWTTVAHAQSARKFGLWGTGPSEIWTVGWCWDIVRYDGTTTDDVGCENFPPSGTHTIGMGVWASSKLNIMTVGVKGGFFHYEGTDFASQPNLDRGNWRDQPTGVPVDLWDIWGTAANNVYAVGEFGTVIKYDGSNWTRQNNIPTGQSLNAIWGSSANDIFAVGDSGAIIHYNGTSWTTHATPTLENLHGVWGWSGSSVYAVGAHGTILHYDGTDWALEASGTNVALSDVGGAANSVRAVGYNGVILKKAERDCVGLLAPSGNSFPGSGGSGIVDVTASGGCNWTAIGNDSWITVTSGASGAGDGAVTYSVSPNPEIGSRTGTITIAGQVFAVNQSPASPLTFAIDDVTHNEGDAGTTSYTFTVTKTGSVAITSSVNFTTVDGTATTANNDYQANTGGLTFLPTDTTKTITVLVNGDTTVEPDEAFTVHLSGASNATISDADGTGTITNDDCTVSLASSTGSFSAAGGAGSIDVTAAGGCAWAATSNASWITITSGGSGTGNGTVNYSVEPNPSDESRAGTITIAGQTFTVNQAGIAAVGLSYYKTDFDSDGKAEIGFYRAGLWGFLKSGQAYNLGSAQFFSWGGAMLQPICADFDGDGKADIAYMVAPSGTQSAAYAILQSTRGYSFLPGDVLFAPAGYPVLGDVPVAGDFDGDGKADPGIWRASEGVWIIPKSSTNYSSHIFSQWGQLGDTPVIADFDMDGKADIGFYRDGLWGVLKSAQNYSLGSAQFFSWGGAGLQPIIGDFDGDSKADIGYMVPPSGAQSAAYAILKSSTGYSFLPGDVLFVAAGWPALGDTPVIGDFDGDGKADPGIWRESQGVWIVPLSTSNYTTYLFSQWGESGDIAFPNSTGKH